MTASGREGRHASPPPPPQAVGIGTALRLAYAEKPQQSTIFDTLLAQLANR